MSEPLRFKKVMRWDGRAKILRLFRVFRNCHEPRNGENYAWKLSLALTPRLFHWYRDSCDLFIILSGIRLHYQRAYGGNYC